MAALQSAFKSLAPVDFSDVPQGPEQLDTYLAELYHNAQTIVESIPIADPDVPETRARAHTTSSIASKASELSSSSARGAPPAPEHLALQKEWGKPLRLNKNENQLGISVYKTSGKDGRGAWFARRSVHEGLGFARFKKAFEREFPTSLAVQGAPGEGNVRGIGAESRVEDIDVPHRGKIEVYRLSAQFPGPTTPRDFITFLVTSSKAIKHHGEAGSVPELAPRHYMIISKPCNHPKTQPGDGFIRGQYESVEFIREIPRKLKTSHSTLNLNEIEHKYHHGHSLEQDLLIKEAERHPIPHHASPEDFDRHHLRVNTSGPGPNSREASPLGRKRSHTVNVARSPSRAADGHDDYDPEENPVEWIMVTRSDPGGSVPRFLVERGTPASICADAVKFLDWACALPNNDSPETPMAQPKAFRRESFTSWHEPPQKEHLKDINEGDESTETAIQDLSPTSAANQSAVSPDSPDYKTPHTAVDRNQTTSPSILSSVAGVFSAYAPQTVLDHLPYHHPQTIQIQPPEPSKPDDDTASLLSSTSFASADSHPDWMSPSPPSSPSITTHSLQESAHSTQTDRATPTPTPAPTNPHEKELHKLSLRRAHLDAKFASTKSKLQSQQSTQSEKEAQALAKAEEKYKKELQRHQEKYTRELEKIEERKKREEKKRVDKKKKQDVKDELSRVKGERDELKEKLKVLEREREVWIAQVGELQRENTGLIARLGKYEAVGKGEVGRVGTMKDEGGSTRSRSSSVKGLKKGLERVGTLGNGSEVSGAGSGLKSESSSLTQGS
jgi:hypothetical protein